MCFSIISRCRSLSVPSQAGSTGGPTSKPLTLSPALRSAGTPQMAAQSTPLAGRAPEQPGTAAPPGGRWLLLSVRSHSSHQGHTCPSPRDRHGAAGPDWGLSGLSLSFGRPPAPRCGAGLLAGPSVRGPPPGPPLGLLLVPLAGLAGWCPRPLPRLHLLLPVSGPGGSWGAAGQWAGLAGSGRTALEAVASETGEWALGSDRLRVPPHPQEGHLTLGTSPNPQTQSAPLLPRGCREVHGG